MPTPENPYPTELSKLVRVLTILQRKRNALANMDDRRSFAWADAQLEVQNLIISEFGYSRTDIEAEIKRNKGG